MLESPVALAMIGVILALFIWVGVRARKMGADLEDYLQARNSQGAGVLGLSFLASGMGAWILFAPPEVGTGIGLVAVVGYALGAAGPYVAFSLLGRRIRDVVPRGHSITEFVRLRYGRVFFTYVGIISIGYMFIFMAAELTAVGGVTAILSGLDARIAVVAVAVATLAYTAYGGLRATLQTDRWQAWLLVSLLAVAFGAVVIDVPDAGSAFADSGLLGIDRLGVEVALTLVIAVVAANMFHQGYWQRVWAARDIPSLHRGAAIGAGMAVPVILIVGALGIIAAGAGLEVGDPPIPFFALMASLPDWVVGLVLMLGVSLVASSVDTLENALGSIVVAERPSFSLRGAQAVTVLLVVPAAFIAFQGYSVLRLFLIADLLCAATVGPVLMGLWSRATGSAAIAGSAAGLIGAIVPGWVETGSVRDGVELATFPNAVPTLAPFFWSLVTASLVTFVVSLAARRETDLGALGTGIDPVAERL